MAIESVGISTEGANSIKSRWGITANEYKYDGKVIDLQDLMVAISKKRATVVEGEVAPLTVRINKRNARLEELGEALAELTKHQTSFESDDSGDQDISGWMSTKTGKLMQSLGYTAHYYDYDYDHDYDEDEVVPDKVRPEDSDERADFYVVTWKYDGDNRYSVNRKTLEGMISRVKSEIDGLNNESQMSMARLQQLVDRRDESFTTATTLMSEISETRDNTIRNL